ISQAYKIVLIVLILFRLSPTKDFLPLLIVLFGFQIAPIAGWIKTGAIDTYFKDVIVASKWVMVPVGFFFFKTFFQNQTLSNKKTLLVRMIGLSLLFLTLNMVIGALGYGSAFYYDGY